MGLALARRGAYLSAPLRQRHSVHGLHPGDLLLWPGHGARASGLCEIERPPNLRWHYILQLGVGLPAAPAIVQSLRVSSGKPPLFGEFMSPPGPTYNDHRDKLAQWHDQNHMFFEIGTLYTVIAGLLNILAIYDAYAGPVIASPEDEKEKDKDKDKKDVPQPV